MHASNVTQTLFENLSFRSERQKVISGNIANVNTPNFKTKELVFDQELKKANDDLELKITHNKHIAFDLDEPNSPGPRQVEVPNLLEQNDGNNVSLDQQISEMSKNSVIFNALQASIKKDAQWFKAIIDSSAKN
ncbi:MAG: flagellar basal body rod protein FlgB [Arcobacteraceae bacterium]